MQCSFNSYNFVTTFKRFFGEQGSLFCYACVAERKSANKFKGALVMKNKKNILATVFALILALSVVTASATAAAANGRRSDKIETLPEIISVESPDDCGVPSVESFVRNLDTLTEKERAALIADLDELARLEKQIDEIYARMTDRNADKLYDEIDAVNDKITAVLERNAELWERVSDEYDVKVAANDPDMTF